MKKGADLWVRSRVFDKARRSWYTFRQKDADALNGGRPISSRACSGGGGADVEETAFCRAAFPDVSHRDNVDTYHKSVLTVRTAPERSTYVDL